jgi:acetolactate synthase I/II/III large subunit
VRTGGRLLAESLRAAGCEVAFGVPGFQALAFWDGAVDAGVRIVGMRTELGATHAADGFGRTAGRPGVAVTTTGPGAVIGAGGLVEPRMSFVPVVNIVSQVPRSILGSGRGGIHELAAQSELLAASATWHAVASEVGELPELVREAFSRAMTPPQGPVVLEVPCDLLTEETAATAPESFGLAVSVPQPDPARIAEVAAMLDGSTRPVLLSGSGVIRAEGARALVELAERLDAPVVSTATGKGAIPADHPLSAGSALYEPAVQELLQGADVLLAVGTELGEMVTNGWSLELGGRLVQVDVRAEHIGRAYRDALPLIGDAALTLQALAVAVADRSRDGAGRVRAVRERLESGLAAQADAAVLSVLGTIRDVLPRDAIVVWDMTISGYVAASFFPVYEPRTWIYPLGSGVLGYAWPAALGAKLARPDADVLAVHGDGGVLYGLAEILTARQERIGAKLLVIDDGGYGILRLIQERSFGRTTGVELAGPDFPALGAALGIPVHGGALREALGSALSEPGPSLIHLPEQLRTLERTA